MNKSRPVVITFSILAGAQMVASATGLSDIFDPRFVFLFGLVVGAVQVGMTYYVQNQVVPLSDTAAYVDQKGNTVAGPASPPALVDGVKVEVIPNP